MSEYKKYLIKESWEREKRERKKEKREKICIESNMWRQNCRNLSECHCERNLIDGTEKGEREDKGKGGREREKKRLKIENTVE